MRWCGLMMLVVFLLAGACNEDPDPDTLADLRCDEIIAEIYDECSIRMPAVDTYRPDRARALEYCREDETYDWGCCDDCIVDHAKLCSSLELCLEDCPLPD